MRPGSAGGFRAETVPRFRMSHEEKIFKLSAKAMSMPQHGQKKHGDHGITSGPL